MGDEMWKWVAYERRTRDKYERMRKLKKERGREREERKEESLRLERKVCERGSKVVRLGTFRHERGALEVGRGVLGPKTGPNHRNIRDRKISKCEVRGTQMMLT
jgi:hypothetical protein